MIVVRDNGWDYDGHDVLFLSFPVRSLGRGSPKLDAEFIENLLKRKPAHYDSYVVAVVEEMLYMRGEPEPLADYLVPSLLFKWKRNPEKFGRSVSNVAPRDEAWQLGKPFIALALVRWKEWKRHDPGLDNMGDTRTFLEAIERWLEEPTPPKESKTR